MKLYAPHKSKIGNLGANLLAMLAYAAVAIFDGSFTVIALILVFAFEKNSSLVRFSCAQGIALMAVYRILRGIIDSIAGIYNFAPFTISGLGVVRTILNFTGSFLWVAASAVVILAYVALCITGAVKAYRWEQWEIPGLASLARWFVGLFGSVAYTGDGPVPPEAQMNDGAQQ